jgi:hypothetical protein
MLRSRILIAGALAAGLAAFAPPARAGMIANASVDLFGTNFIWTYNVKVQDQVHIQAGDYFTIYDFQGAVDGSDFAPNDWTLTTATTTKLVGNQTTPNDDPNLINYTWTYSGKKDLQAGWAGDFGVVSRWEQANTSDFSFVSVGRRDDNNRPYQNITSVEVPVPQGDPPPPPGGGEPPPSAPEPATLVMLGLGLPAFGLMKLRRRK